MRKLLVILLLFSIGLNAQNKDAKDDIGHYVGNFLIGTGTHFLARKGFKTNKWVAFAADFLIGNAIGFAIERQKGNVEDPKDVRINNYGLGSGGFFAEMTFMSNKNSDLEKRLREVNEQLITMYQPQKIITNYSTELKR